MDLSLPPTVTDRAYDRLAEINEHVEASQALRIAVEGGGCSGFKYNFSFDDKIETNDIVFNKTIIDKSSLEIINGSVVDYKKEMIGNSFTIENPKATSSCGCGLSFSI